jgi:AcrR family transcriptional regulator
MNEGRRERNKRKTRERLRDAALALFVDQGFEATSVHQIAEAAGVADRTFYRYFDSKEDLLLADAREYFADVEAFVASRPAEETPMATLLAVRPALEDRWTLGVELLWLSSVISETPAVRAHFLALAYDHHDRVAEIFAARAGAPPDDPGPLLWASAGISAFLNSITLYVRDPRRSNWDYGEELLRRQFQAFGAAADPDP